MKHFVVAGMIGLMTVTSFGQTATAMPLFDFINRALHGQTKPPGEAPLSQRQPVIPVQSNDVARMGQLEEEVRSLTGRIEEMSFQLLQMQEQIRKFQEDNEFRFQELEGGKSGKPRKSGALETTPGTNDQASVPPAGQDDVAGAITSGGDVNAGAPPETLGQIVFDENGTPVTTNQDSQQTSRATLPDANTGINATPDTQQQTASLENPDDLYQSAYGHVLSGDYAQAENEFKNYVDSFPKGAKAADASFWMGEAQYSQGKFNDAAKTFLNAHQAYGKSPKAPEMLLKLGMSLAALDNKDTACATLREVTKRYPKASAAVRAKVTSEESRLAC